MAIYTSSNNQPVSAFGSWAPQSPLPRDQEQSHRLHEPTSMISSIDPISGQDIMEMSGQPMLVDGILTIYFESEETRREFMNTPVNEPFHKLVGDSSEEVDRGG